MQGTFIIIGAMLLLTIAREQDGTAVDWIWARIAIDSLLLGLGMLLLRGVMSRRAGAKTQQRYGLLSTAMLLGGYGWWVLGLGLAKAAPSLLLLTLPLVLLLNMQWWLAAGIGPHPLDRHLRLAMLRQRWRFGLLLPLLLVCCHDLVYLGRAWPPWDHWFGVGTAELVGQLLDLGLLVALLLGMAPLLATAWKARPVEGEEAIAMRRLCERGGVRVGGLWQWPRFELPFYNAMAVGLIGPFRAIFISEDLLAHLDRPQRDAVIGHEIGHLRFNHHLLFILLLMSASLFGHWAGWWLELLLIGPLVPPDLAPALRILLLGIYLLIVIRLIFGVISRACERQADCYGASLAGSPHAMQQALRTVAGLSGQPLDAPSWRHHSIAARIAFLERIHRDPGLASWHHWYVRMLRLILVLILFAVLLLQFGIGIQHPSLDELRANDPQLDRAVAQARAGETRNLYSLIANSEELQRRRIALAILGDLRKLPDTVDTIDPRDIIRQAPLLRPFLRLTTGDERVQLTIKNALSYGLVAGLAQPSVDMLNEADSYYADLESILEQQDDPGLRDTLGCIDLRLGRFDRAKQQFATALDGLPASDDDDPDQAAFRALLVRRLAAAEQQSEALPLEWTPGAVADRVSEDGGTDGDDRETDTGDQEQPPAASDDEGI